MRRLSIVIMALVALSCWKKKPDDDGGPTPTPTDADHPYQVIESDEGLKYHTGLVHKDEALHGMSDVYLILDDCDGLPESFDLRPLGLVSEIRDQGSCGSCWAFSMTNSLESAMLGIGKTLNLAEQELVSCDTDNWGCNGGNLDGFKYQIQKGQSLEGSFPYTASDSRCKSGLPAAAKGISFAYVGAANRSPTEKELKCALYKYKTVPWITVSATNAWGNPPASELTPYNHCGHGQTNHAVGVVGWRTISGKAQFIMKNSWGSDWGDHGYMSLPLGCDSFGEEVAFIQVQAAPSPTPTPVPPTPTPNPTPGPCTPPKVAQAAEIQDIAGNPVMLGVNAEAGVTYQWVTLSNGAVVGSDAMLVVVPPKDDTYKLTAKNSCNQQASSQVRVRIVFSKK